MRVLLVTLCTLFLQTVLFGQALMDFDYPMVNNTSSFFGNYDTALLRKNKVESCQQANEIFYFDYGGRVVKNVYYQSYDSTTQIYLFRYDAQGDLFETEVFNSRLHGPIITRSFKTYEDGRLVKDSNGYMCKHIEYYEDGSLRQELWFGFNYRLGLEHCLQRAFWFGVDSLGRINRIIDRNYMSTTDSAGQLISNRTLLYNEKNQLIKEEEVVRWKKNKQKSLFCPNAGSATYRYDSLGRMIEIIRPNGPSQKINYLPNGLIAEIVSTGKNCEGRPYHWKWTYEYTYRK